MSFQDARQACRDERHAVPEDQVQRDNEQRYFCLGEIYDKIMAVRFTHRCGNVRILGAVFGGKERGVMKKEIAYADETPDAGMEHARKVKDFPPGPKDPFPRKERLVTVRLDDSTVSELKKVAGEKGLGVSSLVRMWVRERLTKANASS